MSATLAEIQTIVRLQLGLKEAPGPHTHLIEELGAESADIVNLIATLEEKYRIFIAEEELMDIQTVTDLHRLVNEAMPGK
jgi:acyl carrier protein